MYLIWDAMNWPNALPMSLKKNETSRITVYDTVLLGRKPYIKWDVSKEDTPHCG